ncbi:MAG: hypothetical protein AAF500_17670 [Myxococcota bacterium]
MAGLVGGSDTCTFTEKIEEANKLKLVFSNGETIVIDKGLQEQAFAIPAGVALEETSVGYNYIITEFAEYPEGTTSGTFWSFTQDTNARRPGIDELDPNDLNTGIFSYSWWGQPTARPGIMESWPDTIGLNVHDPAWQPAAPNFQERVILVQNIGEVSAATFFKPVVQGILDGLYTESQRRNTDGLTLTQEGENIWWFFDFLTGIFPHEMPAQAFYRWKWDRSPLDFRDILNPKPIEEVTPGDVTHEIVFQGWMNMKAKVDLIDLDTSDGPTNIEWIDATLQVLTYYSITSFVPVAWAVIPFIGNCKTRETTSVFKGALAATADSGVGFLMNKDRSWVYRNDHNARPLCDGKIRRTIEENILEIAFSNFRPTLPNGTRGLRNLFTRDDEGKTQSPFIDPRDRDDPLPCQRVVSNPAFLICVVFEDPEINKRRRSQGLPERDEASDNQSLWDAMGNSTKTGNRFLRNTLNPYDALTFAGLRGVLQETEQ